MIEDKIKNRIKRYEDFLKAWDKGIKDGTITVWTALEDLTNEYDIPDFDELDSSYYMREGIKYILNELYMLIE